MSEKATRGNGLLEGFLSEQRSKVSNKLIPEIYRKGNILDIGCGSYPINLIKTNFRNKYGAEKGLTEETKEKVKNKYDINLVKFDIENDEKLNFEDNFFDIVTMLAVFEHIEPKKLNFILSEIYRVTKKNGIYILTTPTVIADKVLRVMANLSLVSKEEIEEHKDAYTINKIKKYLIDANFEENKLNFGYFELGMNIWATAKK